MCRRRWGSTGTAAHRVLPFTIKTGQAALSSSCMDGPLPAFVGHGHHEHRGGRCGPDCGTRAQAWTYLPRALPSDGDIRGPG